MKIQWTFRLGWLLALSCSLTVLAQPTQAWIQTNPGFLMRQGLVSSCDGGVYLVGDGVLDQGDVLKYGPDGKLEWSVDVGVNNAMWAATDGENGNLYVAGFGSVCKIDSSGHTVWTQNSIGTRVPAANAAGDVFLIGGAGLVRYSTNGNLIWARDCGPDVVAVACDNDGGAYVLRYAPPSYDVLAFGPDGGQRWQSRAEGISSDLNEVGTIADVARIEVGRDGDVVTVFNSWGGAWMQGGTDNDVVTVKFDHLTGEVLWIAKLDGGIEGDVLRGYPPKDVATALGMGKDGAVYVVAASVGGVFEHGNELLWQYDYLSAKYTAHGEMVWIRRYDWHPELEPSLAELFERFWESGCEAGIVDMPVSLVLDPEDNVLITGLVGAWNACIERSCGGVGTVGYSADGNLLWEPRVDSTLGGGCVEHPVSLLNAAASVAHAEAGAFYVAANATVIKYRIPPAPARFKRGNANADVAVDIADAIFLLTHLFAQGPTPSCKDAADANDDGALDISDAVKMLAHLFALAGPLPAPFGVCGDDPTGDSLDCQQFTPCN